MGTGAQVVRNHKSWVLAWDGGHHKTSGGGREPLQDSLEFRQDRAEVRKLCMEAV